MKTLVIIALWMVLPACQINVFAQEAKVCLSAEEKRLFDLLIAYRKSKRLTSIAFSDKLTKVAQAHVRDLAANYDYENRGDCNPHSWSDKGGWTPCCYTGDPTNAACMWNKPKEIAGYDSEGVCAAARGVSTRQGEPVDLTDEGVLCISLAASRVGASGRWCGAAGLTWPTSHPSSR